MIDILDGVIERKDNTVTIKKAIVPVIVTEPKLKPTFETHDIQLKFRRLTTKEEVENVYSHIKKNKWKIITYAHLIDKESFQPLLAIMVGPKNELLINYEKYIVALELKNTKVGRRTHKS